jgi:hypothetical protein
VAKGKASHHQHEGKTMAGAQRSIWKLAILGFVLLALGAAIGGSVSRELAAAGGPAPAASSAPPAPRRPTRSPDEQAYLEQLWPIHTDVEVAAERVALGTIFYKTADLDRTELKSRLEGSLASYRAAEGKLDALRPPESLRASHASYLTAVRLFEQSSLEMLKLFDDGSDAHLQAGYPMYLDGTSKIRELGGDFWPDEFPPN